MLKRLVAAAVSPAAPPLVSAAGLVALIAWIAWPVPVRAGSPCALPKSWGSLRASYADTYGRVFVFEAEDGTIRAANASSCKALETVTRSSD